MDSSLHFQKVWGLGNFSNLTAIFFLQKPHPYCSREWGRDFVILRQLSSAVFHRKLFPILSKMTGNKWKGQNRCTSEECCFILFLKARPFMAMSSSSSYLTTPSVLSNPCCWSSKKMQVALEQPTDLLTRNKRNHIVKDYHMTCLKMCSLSKCSISWDTTCTSKIRFISWVWSLFKYFIFLFFFFLNLSLY